MKHIQEHGNPLYYSENLTRRRMRNERQVTHLKNSTARIFILKMKQVQARLDRPF